MYSISLNPNITWENVLSCPTLNANFDPFLYGLSVNLNITLDVIMENLKSKNPKDWYFGAISRRSDVTWDIVQQYPDFPWEASGLSMNPNITWEIIRSSLSSNPQFKWGLKLFSGNPNAKWDDILDSQNVSNDTLGHWNYKAMSSNPMTGWRNRFIQERNQRRCAVIKDELLHKTHQTGYFFNNVLTADERKELGFDEAFLKEASEKYPVKF
jgi:hypothetical protein